MDATALVADWIARTSNDGTRIAAIFPDGPDRYFDTVYNDSYCAEHDLLGADAPTAPATMTHPAERIARSWTRCTTVVAPEDLA